MGDKFETTNFSDHLMKVVKYKYDAFLSHSSRDKQQVREFARKLKDANLKVWFDEWSIKAGDDIYASIEHGLENSNTLILFMSKSAFSSDWVSLEKNTTIFRDPMNKSRRFIPVLMENCQLPDTLSRYKYISAVTSIDSAINEIISSFPKEKRLEPVNLPPNKQDLWGEAKSKTSIDHIKDSVSNHDIEHKSSVFKHLHTISNKCRDENLSSCLFYLDIDGFTLINLKFGVDSGELILGKITNILKENLKGHFVERWGADEFICCLTNVTKQDIEFISKKIIENINKFEWNVISPSLYVTASLGIAWLSYKKKKEDTEIWLERAIIGSYYAKKSGGDIWKDGPKILRDKKKQKKSPSYDPVVYLEEEYGY